MSSRTVPIDLLQASIWFAQRRGWEVEDMLRQAGVSPALLAEGRSRVTEDQLTEFVQQLWRQTDDEMFGLGTHPLPRGSFRLLTYGLIGAKDLAGLLDRFHGLARAMPAIPPLTVEPDGDLVRLSIAPPVTADQDLELDGPLPICVALAVLHRLVAWAIGGRFPLVAVEVPYPLMLEEAHDLVFATPVTFDAPQPALVFDAARLTAPVMRTEAELEDFIARSPAGLLARPAHDATTSDQVRRMVELAIRPSHPSPLPSGEEVAGRLAISQQTLRRRLANDGTSLREVRDAVLRDAAITSLVDGDESVSDLAARLGFSEPSAFTRAFRRWTGNPPTAYRTGDRDPAAAAGADR